MGVVLPPDFVSGETYSVKIGTDKYVNVVSKNFLSFTVDPKYLFSSSEKYESKECVCMASSLAPAYLRIAGPSTAHMTFKNSTITIDNNKYQDKPKKLLSNLLGRNKKRQAVEKLQVASDQWKSFAMWAKATGFEIVFALNNALRTRSGTWDTNSTLDILSVAEKAGISNIFWQLGYECSNQSIDDYLNDLETLRVVLESFPTRGWRVSGADVTGCLRPGSRSDFKDYVTLALDSCDAVLLNGNSSSHELERLSPSDRLRLLKLLHASSTPLWLTEKPQGSAELQRAADWLAGLGYSARNGFAVHYRELSEEELYRPTLSFYMALLYKNLVGERVLSVELESSQALLFAHCTALRRQPVPGAVTLYGVNMDEEPARLSLKLSQREDGGDILQFILSQDEDGNIIVNGRIMSQEGDIRPVVKRVRPYKTLLINLPAKSIGFWVLANTKIEACRDFQDGAGKLVEAVTVEVDVNKDVEKDTDSTNTRRKRSLLDNDLDNFDEYMKSESKEWNDRVDDLNDYLKEVHSIFKSKPVSKTKRHAYEDNQTTTKLKRQLLKTRQQFKLNDEERRPVLNLIDNLLKIRRNGTKFINKIGHGLMLHRSKMGSKNYKITENGFEPQKHKLSRSRRSVSDKYEDLYNQEVVKDNEIDIKDKETRKLWKVLHSIQSQLKKMTEDISEKSQDTGKEDDSDPKAEQDKLVVKTEISEDSASIKFSEKPNHGILKEAFGKLFSAITELNTNLNRFWEAFDFFE
ncbi:heparanase [Ostrinia furnacalis]|uniref:heparanase n=1 Tax=Ostrinia furnacalis TaxID=93504 RepID=UPI00103D6327|nr:heparanase [Ostrinia furnacalis]